MNKKPSKLLVFLMVLSLAFGSAGTAFAGDSKAIKPMEADSIPFHPVLSVSQMPKPAPVTYADDEILPNGNVGVVTPLGEVERGCLQLDVANNTDEGVTIGIYTDQDCLGPAKVEKVIDPSEKGFVRVPIPQKEAYWVAIYSNAPVTGDQTVNAAAYYFSAAEQTVVSNRCYVVGHYTQPQTNYFKYTAKNTGVITFWFAVDDQELWSGKEKLIGGEEGSGTVRLCDSKKASLSNAVALDALSPTSIGNCYTYFGVEKGKTYYLKFVQKSPTTIVGTDGIYVISPEFMRASVLGGATMAKARKLKKDTFNIGTVIAGEKQTQWYKYDITSKKSIIELFADTNNKIKFTIVLQKGKKKTTTRTITMSPNYNTEDLNFKNKKGYTCYIKVTRGTKTSSGGFAILPERKTI